MKEIIQRTTEALKQRGHQANEQIVKRYKATEAEIEQLQRGFPVVSSIVIVGLILGVLWAIGDWLEILTWYFKWIFIPVSFVLAVWWFYKLDESLLTPDPSKENKEAGENELLPRTFRAGVIVLALAYLLTVEYVALRIQEPKSYAWLFWTVFGIVSLVGLWFPLRVLTEGDKTRLAVARVGVISWSLLAGWLTGSIAYSIASLVSPGPGKTENCGTPTIQPRGQNPIRIAVTLSGGGYRAASIHAGVLQVLDNETPIPIDYLTTVSGGSIIGAYYALGNPGQDFVTRLKHKPGLANDKFHILAVSRAFFSRSYRDSDAYADHFRRVYFGNSRLCAARKTTLIVNATNYTTRKREIFTSDPNDPRNNVPIADAVAASGAFPGAFEQKQIGDQYYIDGGVVENLGLEGLRTFLLEYQRPRPNILIISDASKGDENPKGEKKEFRIKLLNEAGATSYQALHRKLYRLFTNNHYDPEDAQHPPQPYFQGYQHLFSSSDSHDDFLFVFVLDGTSSAEQDYMKREETKVFKKEKECDLDESAQEENQCRALRVAKFNTLKELDENEVAMGAWVGQTIATRYADAIHCVIGEIPGLQSIADKAARTVKADETAKHCSSKVLP